jgi:hypothetical protein
LLSGEIRLRPEDIPQKGPAPAVSVQGRKKTPEGDSGVFWLNENHWLYALAGRINSMIDFW